LKRRNEANPPAVDRREPGTARLPDESREEFSRQCAAINLRRIWWILIVIAATDFLICAINFLWPPDLASDIPALRWSTFLALIFLGFTWVLRRKPPRSPGRLRVRQGFVVLFLLAQVVTANIHHFSLLPGIGPTTIYATTVVCLGILLIPARIFSGILLTNHALYCLLVLHSALPALETSRALIDGSFAVAVSALVQLLLYRAKQADFAQSQALALRNEETNELMAIAAHDLRSPLYGLKNLYEAVRQDGQWREDPLRREVAEESARVCGNMLSLVNRLLEAHAADTAGAMPLRPEDLRERLPAALEPFRITAESKKIRIDLELPPEPALLPVNGDAFDTVLGNLLSNALKFSPNGSTVTVALLSGETGWRVEVRDEGPGVAEPERPLLFRKFFRGTNQPTAEEPTAGLGLAIAQRLMEAMGGSVEHWPRSPHGSIFVMRFAGAEGRERGE